MGRKINVCFMMVKESMPFTKCPVLLQLEKHQQLIEAMPTTYQTQQNSSQAS